MKGSNSEEEGPGLYPGGSCEVRGGSCEVASAEVAFVMLQWPGAQHGHAVVLYCWAIRLEAR